MLSLNGVGLHRCRVLFVSEQTCGAVLDVFVVGAIGVASIRGLAIRRRYLTTDLHHCRSKVLNSFRFAIEHLLTLSVLE